MMAASPYAQVQVARAARFVVRLGTNCTARRPYLPDYKGQRATTYERYSSATVGQKMERSDVAGNSPGRHIKLQLRGAHDHRLWLA